MKTLLVASCILAASVAANAQTSSPEVPALPVSAPIVVHFTIDPSRDAFPISPYIYGSNGQSEDRTEGITARRLGGNRLTAYNWENNASNAGTDYLNHSDDYLTGDVPEPTASAPGLAVTMFHDTSLAMHAYSLITLQAAGYVSRDKAGTVNNGDVAPSGRWNRVQFAKGSAFSSKPDTSDGVVYMDEEVAFLVNKYGASTSPTGIRGYEIDNETALWPETHPLVHPAKPSVSEIIQKGTDLSKAVKAVDPGAEMFGPVSFGFSEYQDYQTAPDWNSYKSYGTFLNAYLAKMKEASDAAGKRLLDVLDLHWYPEAQGLDKDGKLESISINPNSDPGVAEARVQAPRTLWDSTYVENSYIGQYFSPVALLPWLNASISNHYPGTKLAFTEFNYGGDADISGGIAMADVLGIFGDYHVYMSNYWEPITGFVSSAYQLYRNYDGSHSAFGNTHIMSSTDDRANSAVHASVDSMGRIHVIAINRNFTSPVEAHFTLPAGMSYSYDIYSFSKADTLLKHTQLPGPVATNGFTCTLDPLTATHIVFAPMTAVPGTVSGTEDIQLAVSPNPMHGTGRVNFTLPKGGNVNITLEDELGKQVVSVAAGTYSAGHYSKSLELSSLPAGTYFVKLKIGDLVRVQPVVVVK